MIHKNQNNVRRAGAFLAALVLAGYASIGAAADAPAKMATDGTLTNAAGMTLYTFDKDAGGKSACNGA